MTRPIWRIGFSDLKKHVYIDFHKLVNIDHFGNSENLTSDLNSATSETQKTTAHVVITSRPELWDR